jgi:hypothetical protein
MMEAYLKGGKYFRNRKNVFIVEGRYVFFGNLNKMFSHCDVY